MVLKELADQLGLENRTPSVKLDSEVSGGYVSDMLSDVIANGKKGDLWITLQVHQNILAVATLKEIAGVVIIGGKEPTAATVAKAGEEFIPILTSPLTAFELAGRLYQSGVRGDR